MIPIIISYLIQPILAFLIGAFMVYLTIPIVVRVSKAKKLFDVPDNRKVNTVKVPNLGGISIFIGISIATLLCLGHLFYPEFRYILSGMIILFFIGIKDDILVLSARKKLIAQFISALIIIIIGNIRFTNLHGFLGIFEINYVTSLFISLMAIVGIINALNLIDGIDGLASGMGIIISLVFGIIFFYMQLVTYSILCFAVMGSLTMFTFFNVFGKVNKIFMGDTGSLILGLLTAIFVIKFNEITLTRSELIRNFAPALSMAIISIPFFDMIRVFLIRIIQKKSPLFPDMNHIHHKLLRLGFSHLKSTLILMTINILLIGIAFLTLFFDINIQLIILVSISAFLSFVPDIIFRLNQKSYSSPQIQVPKLFFETLNDQARRNFPKQDYSTLKYSYTKKSKEKEPEEAVI